MIMKKRKGQILVMFILIIPVFLFLLGAIIDYGRIQIARTYLQGAVDSIALSATKQSFDMVASSNDTAGHKIISMANFTDGSGNSKPGFVSTVKDLINDNNKLNPRYIITWDPSSCRVDNSNPPIITDCVYRSDKGAMILTLHTEVKMIFLSVFNFKPVKLQATGESSLKTKLL